MGRSQVSRHRRSKLDVEERHVVGAHQAAHPRVQRLQVRVDPPRSFSSVRSPLSITHLGVVVGAMLGVQRRVKGAKVAHACRALSSTTHGFMAPSRTNASLKGCPSPQHPAG